MLPAGVSATPGPRGPEHGWEVTEGQWGLSTCSIESVISVVWPAPSLSHVPYEVASLAARRSANPGLLSLGQRERAPSGTGVEWGLPGAAGRGEPGFCRHPSPRGETALGQVFCVLVAFVYTMGGNRPCCVGLLGQCLSPPSGPGPWGPRWLSRLPSRPTRHYDIRRNDDIISFFNDFSDHLAEEALWELSLKIKPRNITRRKTDREEKT